MRNNFKIRNKPETQVRIEFVWNIGSFCRLILFRAWDFEFRIYSFIPLHLWARYSNFGCGSAHAGLDVDEYLSQVVRYIHRDPGYSARARRAIPLPLSSGTYNSKHHA